MTGGADGGGVAYVAHIGGFLAGMLLIKLLGGHAHPALRNPTFTVVDQADYRR